MRSSLVSFVSLLSVVCTWYDNIVVSGEIQVIGAGFGRTGTESLHHALDYLGYKTYHMSEIIHNNLIDHAHLWRRRFTNETTDMSELVDDLFEKHGYTAVADFPAAAVWTDLADVYPNAKIILTERDSPYVWWESASNSIMRKNMLFRIIFQLKPVLREMAKTIPYMWKALFWFDQPRHVDVETDKEAAIAAYNRNSELARSYHPPRMLIFNVKQGWGPLCEFLDKPVPDIPFPHKNSRAQFYILIAGVGLGLMGPPILLVALFLYYFFAKYQVQQRCSSEEDEVKQKDE